jgi:hypothetical protein
MLWNGSINDVLEIMNLPSTVNRVLNLTFFGLPIGAVVIAQIGITFFLSLLVLFGLPIGLIAIIAIATAIINIVQVIYVKFLDPSSIQDFKTLFQMKWALRIGMDDGRHWSVLAMQRFAKGDATQAEREAIAVMMRGRIAKKMNKADHFTINRVHDMLKTLAAAAPDWEAVFLVKVAGSEADATTRGAAIRRMVDLRGVGSLDLLMTLVDDPQVAADVAGAIASIGPAAATQGVIVRLKRMLAESQIRGGWGPSEAARALIAIGQATDPDLVTHMDNFDIWTRFVVRVKCAGFDASTLTALLFRSGIVGEDRRRMIKGSMLAKMEKTIGSGEGFNAIINFLQRARSVYAFDTEWDPVPDYKVLLMKLSKISSPRLPISNIAIREDGEVLCRIAGHPACFHPKFMGDWTDLQAVIVGLNAALVEAGLSERFANIQSGGQDAYVIVGTVNGLAELVETVGFPLDENGSTPAAIGYAVEEYAAAQIQAEHPGAKITRSWTERGK